MDKGSTAERLPQSDRWKLSTGPLWDPFRITVQGITTRLLGIDTPEMNTTAGRLVAEVVRIWLNEASRAKYQLRWISAELDMYGRSLGDFRDRNDPSGQSLAMYLLGRGFAKPYKERREIWTPEELQLAVAAAQDIIGD